MESIKFAKLSGAGNDFVIIDNRENILPENREKFVSKVCARRISVGADGLLLVENSDEADFKMRYYNSDGGEVETCGNGARCIARFAYMEKLVPSNEMTFETRAGIYSATVMIDTVKLKLGDASQLRLDFPLKLEDGTYTPSFANSGVPHVVYFVDDLENTEVVKLGRQTRYHKEFQPAGTNANFIKMRQDDAFDIRTYERGVEDETLACGTGCIASAIVAGAKGKASSPITAYTRGGYVLKVYFKINDDGASDVHLEGDARVICKGKLLTDSWNY
ncbi:diaminopimelate epimerase [Candidatus Poribacteria bacterium]|nr:diaminopimelate epimerase [Candidatus Poribacteria bacterium]